MTQKKVPSMKRRCENNDYTDRGIYMITMAIEGRRPLLGTLTGKADVTEGPESPAVVLTPLGEKVRDCWYNIPLHYPAVEVMKLCIMPDHIHGVLFVHERMACHLGVVIKGFKAGTHQAARELGIMAADSTAVVAKGAAAAPGTATMSQCTPTEAAGGTVPSSPYTATTLQSPASPLQSPASPLQSPTSPLQSPVRSSSRLQQRGALWEHGYHDRLLRQAGQLDRMLAYLEDNPRRLLLKRSHPAVFTPIAGVMVAGRAMSAMGNLDLLNAKNKLQLQCSRHLYPNEIEQRRQHFLDAGRRGAVVVSPSISPGERLITTACLEEKIPLIVLLLKGFPPFFKPAPRYLIACAEGRLLMLSPYPWQNERLTNMRARCLELNALAASICKDQEHSL